MSALNKRTASTNFNGKILLSLMISGLLMLSQSPVIAQDLNSKNTHGVSGAGINPTRIVVTDGARSGSITLTNTSNSELSYRMSLVEMGLDAEGVFRKLSKEELPTYNNSAKELIRFSPRQVRLKPGQSQVVRAIVRRGKIKRAGEYRSHLRLQALPILTQSLEDTLNGSTVLVQASTGINVGVTIPVIIRHGSTDAQVTVKEATLSENTTGAITSASLLMGLSGNRSSYGDFSLYLVNNNREKLVGRMKGFALYHPYPEETIRIPFYSGLKRSDFTDGSRLRVVFENKAIDSDKSTWTDQIVTPIFSQ